MAHLHITLSTPPWETPKPKPKRRKRYPRRRFPGGTRQIEKYWRRGQITDQQYHAACKLANAHSRLRTGYSVTKFKERVQENAANGSEEAIDNRIAFSAIMNSIPEELHTYVDLVILQDKSLWSMTGCSGGANHKRYLARLGTALDAVIKART